MPCQPTMSHRRRYAILYSSQRSITQTAVAMTMPRSSLSLYLPSLDACLRLSRTVFHPAVVWAPASSILYANPPTSQERKRSRLLVRLSADDLPSGDILGPVFAGVGLWSASPRHSTPCPPRRQRCVSRGQAAGMGHRRTSKSGVPAWGTKPQ